MGRIFGPVASRRLGKSLGIDVIPYKTCSFDCIYCECGKTTDLTVERREFFPVDQILGELRERLSGIKESPDVITLSGAGEPCLYSRLGELISGIKEMSAIPVAVITNSSLLSREDVRNELMLADIVVPSLDTAVASTFETINRPHESLAIESVIEGLEMFLGQFIGKVFLEILLLEGFNAGQEELSVLRSVLGKLKYDSIQLNTAVRPGTDESARPLGESDLERIRGFLGQRCEIVAGKTSKAAHEDGTTAEHILSMIERRPCTAEEIGRALGISHPQLIKFLDSMRENASLRQVRRGGDIYYIATDRKSS